MSAEPKPALDGSWFHDQRRRRSPELARAFASVLRMVSRGPQSEMSAPDEISLEPDAAISDGIVRRIDA